jgi:hypothetical protein
MNEKLGNGDQPLPETMGFALLFSSPIPMMIALSSSFAKGKLRKMTMK